MSGSKNLVTIAGDRSAGLRRSAEAIVVVSLLAIGLFSLPVASLGPGRSLLPGDPTAARANIFLLEHFHQWVTGRTPHYQAPTLFTAQDNAAVLSDNLLATAPMFSLFRSMGFTRETSFQLWLLVLFALNYLVCWWALWRYARSPVIAACGAYVFAFGIHALVALDHAQLLARFPMPLAMLACTAWLERGGWKQMAGAVLSLALQFYCGVRMGNVLLVSMVVLVLVHSLVNGRTLLRDRGALRKRITGAFVLFVGAPLLAAPVVLPYSNAARDWSPPNAVEMLNTQASIHDLFHTHRASLSWHDLSFRNAAGDEVGDVHHRFVGAVPWLGLLLVSLLVRWRGGDPVRWRSLLTLLFSLATALLLSLRFNALTTWPVLHALPGFESPMDFDRLFGIQVLLFCIVFVMVFSSIAKRVRHGWLIAALLPVLVVLDNNLDARELRGTNKYALAELSKDMERHILLQRDTASIVAFVPALWVMPDSAHDRLLGEMNVSAMLAAQRLRIPTVNAYPENASLEFRDLLQEPTAGALVAWCGARGGDPHAVRLINNLDRTALGSDTIAMAIDGEPVQVDASGEVRIGGDRATLFVRIRFGADRWALLAENGSFVSAETFKVGSVVAHARSLGDAGLFTSSVLEDGSFLLIADNGRYIAMDDDGSGLVANADSSTGAAHFTIIRSPDSGSRAR